jgi:hypothetical protein
LKAGPKPLTLFLMVAVEVLYVEEALGQPAALPNVPPLEGGSEPNKARIP